MFLAALFAVTLGAVAIVGAILANSYFFGCPPELRHLPTVSVFRFVKHLLSGEPLDVRAKFLGSSGNEDGFARLWYMLRWMIIVTNPRHVRKILGDTEMFPKYELATTHPDLLVIKLIGRNIVNVNGAEWKRHRKIVAPAFHNFQVYVEVFAESAKELSGIINNKLKNDPGSPVNVTDLFQRMTVDVICKAGFHYSLGALSGKNSHFLSAYRTFIKLAFEQIPVMLPFLDKFNFRGRRTKFIQSAVELDEKLYEVIAERRKQIAAGNREQQEKTIRENATSDGAPPPNDLLALMIRACDADGTLTSEELRNNLLLFFIAGHETTANALSSALYYLSAYPAVQEKARAECNSIMAGEPKDATPTFDQQKRMNYLTCVVKECLRLNGPVIQLGFRVCAPSEGAYLGSQHIPQGTIILPNIYSFHHDPRAWGENVLEFDPLRFVKEDDEGVGISETSIGDHGFGADSRLLKVESMYWMPFGGGNRVCTGKNFSLIEQRVVLAHLLRQYKFSLPPDSKHRHGVVNTASALLAPDTMTIKFDRI